MKKTTALILAFVLSASLFVTDVMSINLIVRADEEAGEYAPDAVGSDFGDYNDESAIDAEYEKWVREMEEEAAREAEEEARKAAEDEAAREAQRQAEEQAERARKEAEEAEEAEKAQKDASQNYSLSITVNGYGSTRTIDFGTEQVGVQRDYRELYVTNSGNTDVDLIYTERGDADGAFTMSLHGDRTHLMPGESSKFLISMRSDLSVGTYKCALFFASSADPGFTNAAGIDLTGRVEAKQAVVKSVDIIPSRATAALGSVYEFYADVDGSGNYDDSVIWSISGHRSPYTFISGNGGYATLNVDSSETANTINVMATSAANPQATGYAVVSLQKNSYNVNVAADPQNGGQVSGGGAVSQGGSVTLSAVPNKNFYFVGWVRDGQTVSTSTNYTIKNITSNISVGAKFAQRSVTVNVDVNNANGGTVSGGGTITYGGETTLSAKAYSGYAFTGWKENGSVISRDASIKLTNLTSDRRLTAMFEQTTHTVTVVSYPADAGTVSGGGTFKLNEGTTIKATPKDGYTFSGWYIGGQVVSRDATYKINKVEQDYTVTAAFDKKGITTFEISSGVATTGGSISPSGKTLVAQGQKLTYTITPKSGFAILAVAVDGVQVGAVNTYTFTNVQGPHTISAAFVQTDAGQKAQVSSGKQAQTQKVQAIPKTTSNTATTTSTVDINEAAAGEGGDNFVEEMDLTDVYIPTDEELGIKEEVEVYSEVTKMMGIPFSEVENMIASGNVVPILDAAFYTGSLDAYVQNQYEPRKLQGVDYRNMTAEEIMLLSDDSINPSLPNLDVVVTKMLSNDEIMTIAKGGQVGIAVSLTKQEADPVTERVMKNAVGQKAVQYFDLTMLKTANGYTENVTELPTAMEVVIEIPQDIYKSNKTYSVLRVHNGQLSVLPDLDDDPKTITFCTDKFSSYAIAQEVATSSSLVKWLIAGAAIAFGIAFTCFMVLLIHQARWVKTKKKVKS